MQLRKRFTHVNDCRGKAIVKIRVIRLDLVHYQAHVRPCSGAYFDQVDFFIRRKPIQTLEKDMRVGFSVNKNEKPNLNNEIDERLRIQRLEDLYWR